VPRPAVANTYIFPTLGAGGNFAVFGMTGTLTFNEAGTGSNVTVYGNEGISSGDTVTALTSYTKVYGSIAEYTGGQITGITTGVVGTIGPNTTEIGLVNANVTAAANLMTGWTADTTVATAITGGTYVGTDTGVNVIDFTSTTAGSLTSNLILNGNGNANSYFVVNISAAGLALNGYSLMLTNGAKASNVIWNFIGTSGAITTVAGDQINGTIIAPLLSVTLSSTTLNGQLFSGKNITLGSGTIVNGTTPEAPTLWLIGGALIGLAFLSKRARTSLPARG
jgi:choice-of-anchor A domain-containing protein